MAWLRIAAVKPPFVAVGKNSPREDLRFVEVVAYLLMRIALPAFADLRERVIYLFRLEDGNGGAVPMRRVLINDGFLFRFICEKDVVRLEILFSFRLAKIVRPSETESFQNFVQQFLAGEGLIVLGTCNVALLYSALQNSQTGCASPSVGHQEFSTNSFL